MSWTADERRDRIADGLAPGFYSDKDGDLLVVFKTHWAYIDQRGCLLDAILVHQGNRPMGSYAPYTRVRSFTVTDESP